MNFEQLIDECESLMRAGRPDQVHRKLSLVNPDEVPRQLRPAMAHLCRQSGLLNTGLRLLTPLVRPDGQAWGVPSPREVAEYAMLLERSGTLQEALTTLQGVHLPEAMLYRGFCLLDLGDHSSAAQQFESYLHHADPSDSRISAEIGLVSAWIGTGKLSHARALLNEILSHDASHPSVMEPARDLDVLLGAAEAQSPARLLEYRKEAESRKYWERVREADRLLLKLEFNEDRFHWLLFGTPFSKFRQEVEKEHGRGPSRREIVFGVADAPMFNLATGELTGPWAGQTPPRLIHELINALLKDFYRPISAGGLFGELFPDEHFNVETSIHRMHQAIHRARKWFEERQIPLAIVEFRGHYSLKVEGSFGILVPYERRTLDAESRRFRALINHFGGRGFTARQARQALGLSPAVFKSLMNWAEESGHVSRLGAGPSTRYKINAA